MNTNTIIHISIMALALMLLAWLYQVKTKNAGIVDATWAYGIMLASIYYSLTSNGDTQLRILVALIAGLWFLRLGTHIFLRMLSEPEDGRYAYVRELYGSKTNLFHAGFFLFQAGLIVLFSLPMWLVAQHSEPSSIAMIVSVVIVVVAFIGEYQADHQLHLFRSDPSNKGKTCRIGLWRYSRHPNYFFEWCHWFAYPVMAIGMAEGIWLWLAPVCMFIFLWFITGIPFTEKQALKSRGEDYRHYQKTTSGFFLWPPAGK